MMDIALTGEVFSAVHRVGQFPGGSDTGIEGSKGNFFLFCGHFRFLDGVHFQSLQLDFAANLIHLTIP